MEWSLIIGIIIGGFFGYMIGREDVKQWFQIAERRLEDMKGFENRVKRLERFITERGLSEELKNWELEELKRYIAEWDNETEKRFALLHLEGSDNNRSKSV